jgi:hypothetical protein
MNCGFDTLQRCLVGKKVFHSAWFFVDFVDKSAVGNSNSAAGLTP